MLASYRRSKVSEDAPSSPSDWLDRHGDYLYRYALLRVRDTSAAEDLLQETLLAALHSHNRFVGRSSERTWLVGILIHKIIDHYRNVSRAREIWKDEMQLQDYNPFETAGQWAGHWRADLAPTAWQLDSDTLEKKEFWESLNRCLSELPPRMAMAFTLREIDGLSSEEVCDVLNVSQNNLGVMLHRARLKLRSSLEAEWCVVNCATPKDHRMFMEIRVKEVDSHR